MITKVVVSGTGTEVGKTWVAARLARSLRRAGVPVAARKPVQSYDEAEGPTDADVLAAATGEDPHLVCRPVHWYALPLAPPMAAEALGAPPISIDDLVGGLDLPRAGVCLVEGIGGPRSPLADNGDTVELANAIDADLIVLVAEPNLGVLNDVSLGIDAFAPRDVVVFLNRYDDGLELHRRNRSWLTEAEGLRVVVDTDEIVGSLTEPEV
jgi:dethiobiotin synthetase